jgi:hypothetical protein
MRFRIEEFNGNETVIMEAATKGQSDVKLVIAYQDKTDFVILSPNASSAVALCSQHCSIISYCSRTTLLFSWMSLTRGLNISWCGSLPGGKTSVLLLTISLVEI